MALGETSSNEGHYESFIREQLDADTISDKTAMILRGYRYDPNEQIYTNMQKIDGYDTKTKEVVTYKIVTKPLLNEEGIKEVMSELRPRLYNVFSSGSLSNNDIRTIRHAVADILWKKLRHNRKYYDLSLENFESILYVVDDQLFLFLSRTEKGGFLRALKTLIGRRENVNMNVSEDSKPGTITKGGNLFN